MKSNLKVLIVHDNPNEAKQLSTHLNKFYESTIHTSASKEEYIKELTDFEPDIILSVYHLTSFSGMEALAIQKQLAPFVPFIFITESLDEETAVECIKAGADDYILKKKVHQLIPAINSAIEKKEKLHINEANKKQLEDREEWYRLIMENSMDAILLTSPDGNIYNANKAACKLFGMSIDEMCRVGRNGILDVNDPNLAVLLEERKRTGKAIGELTFIRKDKSKFTGEVSASLFVKSNGETRSSMIIRDITDRKVWEEILKRSEENFRIAITNSPVTVFNQDKELRYTWIYHPNPNFDAGNALGKTDDDLLLPDEAKILKHIKTQVLTSGKIAREIVKATINGMESYLDVTVEPIKNSLGQINGIAGASIDITERILKENTLKERETFIRAVMDNLPVGIAVNTVEPSVKFEYINDNFAKIYGTTREALSNADAFWEAVYEDPVFREEIKKRILSDCATGNPDLMRWEDIPITRKGEATKYINAMNVPIPGRKVMVSIVWDVTDRKLAEDALLKEQYFLHTLMDYSPDFIYFKDSQSRFIRINRTQAILFNLDFPSEAVGKTDFDFFSEEHARQAFNDEQHIIKTGQPIINKEEKETWPDGSITWASTSKIPMRDKHGDIIGTFGISRNITEKKKIEERLKLLSCSVEQSPVSKMITDPEAKILFVNSSFTDTSGYTFEEIVGKRPSVLKSGYHSNEFYQNLWDTILSGKNWKGELLNKKKNGELYWETVSISPIVNENGDITHFVAAKEDITEKKKLMEDLIYAKELAEKSDRLKSEFLAQMSHEIRSPLNVVLNFSDLLRIELGKKAETELFDFFDGIESAGKRLLRTIDLILNVSEMQVGTYEATFTKFGLVETIENVKKENIYRIEQKGLEFKIFSDLHEVFVKGDKYSIYQIFSNLIDNAVKYTDTGSIYIRVFERKDFKDVLVEIEDTGIGMTEGFMKNLFKPFLQEDHGYSRKFEGNGLGLSLVKKYCDLNGITISVESVKDKGTKFSLIFMSANV